MRETPIAISGIYIQRAQRNTNISLRSLRIGPQAFGLYFDFSLLDGQWARMKFRTKIEKELVLTDCIAGCLTEALQDSAPVGAWSTDTIGENHWGIPASAASESDRCLRR